MMTTCARHDVSGKAATGVLQSRLWREFDSFVDAHTQQHARRAATVLGAEGLRAADRYEKYGPGAALEAADENEWLAYVSRAWLSIAPLAGVMIDPYLNSLAAKAAVMADRIVAAASQYIRQNGMSTAQAITRASNDKIANQIRIGMEKGESQGQIADRIRKHYRSITPARAQTIARTEVHAAANFGTLTAASEQREPMRKIWLATPDGLTRDAHMETSGQKRALGQPFTMEGERLQFPGDSSMGAPGSLVIKCRCTMAFESARRPARPPKPSRRPAAA